MSNIKIPNNKVELVNLIFTQLEVTYHNQFHKAYPDKNSLNLAKQLWLAQLQKFEEKIVFDSVSNLMTSSEFLPSLSKLVVSCKELKANRSGIPNVSKAHQEVCNSKSNFEKFSWSHPIVFYMGTETGWDFLWTHSEKESFKEFQVNYDNLLNEFIDGRNFQNPNFPKLPKKVESIPDKSSQLSQIKKLKNKLIN